MCKERREIHRVIFAGPLSDHPRSFYYALHSIHVFTPYMPMQKLRDAVLNLN